ncbi:hypothetical protein [Streptomyces sp. NRRL S-1521]
MDTMSVDVAADRSTASIADALDRTFPDDSHARSEVRPPAQWS